MFYVITIISRLSNSWYPCFIIANIILYRRMVARHQIPIENHPLSNCYRLYLGCINIITVFMFTHRRRIIRSSFPLIFYRKHQDHPTWTSLFEFGMDWSKKTKNGVTILMKACWQYRNKNSEIVRLKDWWKLCNRVKTTTPFRTNG